MALETENGEVEKYVFDRNRLKSLGKLWKHQAKMMMIRLIFGIILSIFLISLYFELIFHNSSNSLDLFYWVLEHSLPIILTITLSNFALGIFIFRDEIQISEEMDLFSAEFKVDLGITNKKLANVGKKIKIGAVLRIIVSGILIILSFVQYFIQMINDLDFMMVMIFIYGFPFILIIIGLGNRVFTALAWNDWNYAVDNILLHFRTNSQKNAGNLTKELKFVEELKSLINSTKICYIINAIALLTVFAIYFIAPILFAVGYGACIVYLWKLGNFLQANEEFSPSSHEQIKMDTEIGNKSLIKRFCTECGAEISGLDHQYCPNCGHPIKFQ